jgi:hypothetical protein
MIQQDSFSMRTSFSTPPLPLSVRSLKLPLFQDFVHIEESKEDIETELESTMTIISSRLLLYVRALTESVPALMADVLNRGKLCCSFCVYFQLLMLMVMKNVDVYYELLFTCANSFLAPFQVECDALEREIELPGTP